MHRVFHALQSKIIRANNKISVQPVRLRRLTSVFAIHTHKAIAKIQKVCSQTPENNNCDHGLTALVFNEV